MLVRIELQAAKEVLNAGISLLCVSPEGWQVFANRPEEVDRLYMAGWYLYADEATYERDTGENIAGEVIGTATGLDCLISWIGEAETQDERKNRTAYGRAWVKGQVRLGVFAREAGEKILDFLAGFCENT